jgi:hypothetical protein
MKIYCTELTIFCWGAASSATAGVGEFLAATKDRPCIFLAPVWLTKVIVVVIAVHTVMLLILSDCTVASETVEFLLPVLHQKCRHFAGQVGLQNSKKMR